MEGRPPFDDDLGPPDELDDGEPGELGSGTRGLIPDAVKKAILAGVGAVFMTEEGARKLARDWKLPKDVIGFVGQQAHAAKDEILRSLGDEIRRFLQSDLVRREFLKALTGSTIEVKMEIRMKQDGEGTPRAEVTSAVRRKRPAKKKDA